MGGRDYEIRRLKVRMNLKAMSSLHVKTHLATIRTISIPALISILNSILKEEYPIFQLLMSRLYNYLGSVHLQECMCKKQSQTNLKTNYNT